MVKRFSAIGLAIALCGLAAPQAFAVNVRDCDGTASVASIAEHWQRNARAHKGEVRVALLDTGGEPACCSQHGLILAPDKTSEMGDRLCGIVSDHKELGFAGIAFPRLVVCQSHSLTHSTSTA